MTRNFRILIRVVLIWIALGTLEFIGGCTLPNTLIFSATSRLHAQNVPDGSLWVGKVIGISTELEMAQLEPGNKSYNFLIGSNLTADQIRNGKLLVARVFCCGGPNEEETNRWAYVPENLI